METGSVKEGRLVPSGRRSPWPPRSNCRRRPSVEVDLGSVENLRNGAWAQEFHKGALHFDKRCNPALCAHPGVPGVRSKISEPEVALPVRSQGQLLWTFSGGCR